MDLFGLTVMGLILVFFLPFFWVFLSKSKMYTRRMNKEQNKNIVAGHFFPILFYFYLHFLFFPYFCFLFGVHLPTPVPPPPTKSPPKKQQKTLLDLSSGGPLPGASPLHRAAAPHGVRRRGARGRRGVEGVAESLGMKNDGTVGESTYP